LKNTCVSQFMKYFFYNLFLGFIDVQTFFMLLFEMYSIFIENEKFFFLEKRETFCAIGLFIEFYCIF
jgi:hypothetical protein